LIEKSAEAGDANLVEYNMELLKQMTFYASSTDCLRGRLLSYFGETPENYCGACSNCLSKFESVDITVDAQKIISCVYRLKQRGKRFGRTIVIQILRGSKSAKITNEQLETLSVWGIMKDSSINKIRTIIDFLILREYLALSSGDYPALVETAKSGEIIFDKKPLGMMLPKDEVPVSATDMKTDEHGELFARLKTLRSRLASESRVPAYIIFTDAALSAMCRSLPLTKTAFLEIPGVGTVKAEKYGDAFISAIKDYKKMSNEE
jgi:ATP-dependent DNA helicase RecQ